MLLAHTSKAPVTWSKSADHGTLPRCAQRLMASEREKLLHMAETLHRRVVGQDEAVDAVAQAIQRCTSVPLFVAVCG